MARGLWVLALMGLALAGCGPGFDGSWSGTLSGTAANGSPFSYGDTWNISGAGTLKVTSLQTCTAWQATPNGDMATWATWCGSDVYSGTMQLQGGGLAVNIQIQPSSHVAGQPIPTATASGTFSRK